tara:strand:- start:702 stop:953 length:252 start_codon:yes stop_codon:yes gene_type:complete
MKLTKLQLKKIIKEELEMFLKENYAADAEAIVDALRKEHGEGINVLSDEDLSTLTYEKAQEMQVSDTFRVAELAHDMLLVGHR